MERLRSIAKDAAIKLKQSYRFVDKQLLRATRKLRTCAGRLLREVQRKLPEEATAAHQPVLELCQQVLAQQRHDKNKVYSHRLEPAAVDAAAALLAQKFAPAFGTFKTSNSTKTEFLRID